MEKRTTYSGLVNESMVGQTITLQGWVQRRRDFGGLIFVDLRDREGISQVVFDEEIVGSEAMKIVDSLRSEYVIRDRKSVM